MLFTVIFVSCSTILQSSVILINYQIIHLIFSWSKFLSWFIFAGDLLLIGFLSWHAYHDGEKSGSTFDRASTDLSLSVDTLDHFEVPFFGRLANSFVDDE